MSEVEAYLAGNFERYLEELKRFCAIASVSTDPAHGADIAAAARFVAERLRVAGLHNVDIVRTGGHPAITAEWLGAPGAPTILVYGHYDVQPPDPLEKWLSRPFEPTIRDDRLYARGVSDDKGPVLIPILVAEAFLATRGQLPLNLKILIEGEEEIGSPHLAATVSALKQRLACDLVLSADGAMWRADVPSITIANRGLVALEIAVRGPGKDLHSGRHGGSAPNPIRALTRILARMHDPDGRVSVPGFLDGATPPDPKILDAIERSGFDAGRYFREIGASLPEPPPTGAELLRRQWLEPTLEFNGISGGYGGPGTKTVIPTSASVKITCRLVAGQDPDRVVAAITRHAEALLPSGFALDLIRYGPGTKAFALDPDLPALTALETILADLTGQVPLRVAMGATIPIGGVFRDVLGAPTLFFSFSTSDEDYHAPNEFFRISSFRRGLVAWTRAFEALAVPPVASGPSKPRRLVH